ncbi:MAG: 5'-nucleotidase C-terminal domain-containing protein [Candidatus Riflebacteria bacterium]|nr:5'-nucleotidase C-terminal domain-containing protein [Candidatus Riflebacteria bacterium]
MIKILYQSGKWQIEQGLHRILPIDSSSIEPDPELSQEISKFESKIDNLLDEVVTTSKGQFNHSFLEESTIGTLIADSMKEASGADIALTNSGGIKSVIYEGQVTLRNLYEILPFENNLMTVELKGNELETLIEQSLCDSKSGFLQSSGINCMYSTINPGGCRIIQLDINDKPIEFNAVYTVAINDFMYANSLDWPELSAGKNPKINGMIRESFKDYLKKRNSITPNTLSQYKESDDDVLIRFPLTTELVTLSQPITQDVKTHYEYATLVCEMIRRETKSDFALMPSSMVHRTREPLQIVTMSRVFSDFSTKEGVSVVEMSGKMINTVLLDSFKAQNNISFAGFSIEKTDNTFKIYPWNDSFEEDTMYKVAVNESFVEQLNRITHSTLKSNKRFSDIRRTFIDGLRKVDGKVDLKRVFY